MWFLDTGYLIALFSPRDAHHTTSVALKEKARREQRRLLTTDAVILEVGAAFAKSGFRPAGIALMRVLLSDPLITVVPLTPALRDRAITLFAQRADKEWSLCDCVSFVVMRDEGIEFALTPDHHFTQAGFQPLMAMA